VKNIDTRAAAREIERKTLKLTKNVPRKQAEHAKVSHAVTGCCLWDV
jgi:hypothetical protein